MLNKANPGINQLLIQTILFFKNCQKVRQIVLVIFHHHFHFQVFTEIKYSFLYFFLLFSLFLYIFIFISIYLHGYTNTHIYTIGT